ncbi:hypothetical protein [Anaerosporobacter sp.]|uniref:hypothetical protein n=1 Tax=Anaerosporobacter sp. TaxID=1872529 RepID=UPI00286F6F86|nr:hypothetical protein [Anaerosporobacter sp.]
MEDNQLEEKTSKEGSDVEETIVEKLQEQKLQIQDVRWSYDNINLLSSGIDKLVDLQSHLNDLKIYRENVKQLVVEDEDLERIIVAKERTIEDEVDNVIKKRKAEVSATFDSQLDNTKADIKKVKTKREKKKNKKVSERIQEETADLRSENAQLKDDISMVGKNNRVPRILNTRLIHALYYPKGWVDIGIDLICILVLFVLVPNIIFHCIVKVDKPIVMGCIYFGVILIFGAIYLALNAKLKNKYHETFKKVKEIRTKILANRKSMNKIKRSVKRDKDESNYGLEKYNKEITDLEETIEIITNKKKEAIAEFENTSKAIIANEIREKNKPELLNLQQKHEEVHELSKEYSSKVKELEMQLASTYETYLGKEFMNLDKLEKLIRIMESKEGMLISEALKLYQEQVLNN